MRCTGHPVEENLRQGNDNLGEMETLLDHEDFEQTLQERIEAGELTQIIIESGLLDDTL